MKSMVFLALGLVAIGAAPTSKPAYTYRGKPVTAQWVDRQFKDFGAKLTKIDGKFVSVDPIHVDGTLPPQNPPEVGAAFDFLGEVLQVLSDGTLIVDAHTSNGGTVAVWITGADKNKFAEGSKYTDLGVFVGVKRQGTRSLQEYRFPRPLTRDEFVEAIGSGVELVRYQKAKNGKVITVPVR